MLPPPPANAEPLPPPPPAVRPHCPACRKPLWRDCSNGRDREYFFYNEDCVYIGVMLEEGEVAVEQEAERLHGQRLGAAEAAAVVADYASQHLSPGGGGTDLNALLSAADALQSEAKAEAEMIAQVELAEFESEEAPQLGGQPERQGAQPMCAACGKPGSQVHYIRIRAAAVHSLSKPLLLIRK